MRRYIHSIIRVLLTPIAIVFSAIATAGIGVMRFEDRSAAEVAKFLQDFVQGSGGEWDWDDFTSIQIKDPVLDDIRKRATAIALPVDERGLEQLHELLIESERLANAEDT